MKKTLLVLALLAMAAPDRASGQSFLGFRGLGVPVGAADGRSVALGNLGIGLARAGLSVSDPAAAAEILFPSVFVSMQPMWGDFQLEDQNGTMRTTRFPLIAIGYPVLSVNGTVTLSLAGYLEQRWVGHTSRTVNLGGIDVPVEDRFTTDGGTSVARVGWAQRLGARFSVGASAGAYVGRLEREFDRTLDSLVVGSDVRPYREASSWHYGGYTLSAGFGADPHALIHLAGALEWSGNLKESPSESTGGGENRYSIPLRLLWGATGRLSERLHLNTSFAYQDWSGADGFQPGVVSAKTLSYGAGLELQVIQRPTRGIPLRLGYRRGVPPFRYQAEDPVETAWSLGLGINLVEVDGIRYGWMDVAIERAERSSAPLNENFWRATVSLGITRF